MSKKTNAWSMQTNCCPFARGETATSISCEGFIDDVAVLTAVYSSGRAKATQKRIFCDRDYQKCEVYRMIMDAKYSG